MTILLDETTKPELLNKLLKPLGYYLWGVPCNWVLANDEKSVLIRTCDFDDIEFFACSIIKADDSWDGTK